MRAAMLLGAVAFFTCAGAMLLGAVLADGTGDRITLLVLAIIFFPIGLLFYRMSSKRARLVPTGEPNTYTVVWDEDPATTAAVSPAAVIPTAAAAAPEEQEVVEVQPDQLQQVITEHPGTTIHLVDAKVGSAAEILANGTPARATVIATFPTDATTPEGDPVVGYILNVQPTDGRPPYRVQLAHRTPRTLAAVPAPGAELPVKIDPGDPEAVAIDWKASEAGDSAPTV